MEESYLFDLVPDLSREEEQQAILSMPLGNGGYPQYLAQAWRTSQEYVENEAHKKRVERQCRREGQRCEQKKPQDHGGNKPSTWVADPRLMQQVVADTA